MRSILLVLALLSSTVLQAQLFSGGARTGIGFWRGNAYNPETGLLEAKRQTLWEKEIFFRYEPGKRFAFEAGLTHFEAEAEKPSFGDCGTIGMLENYSTGGVLRDKYYGLNLRVQYDVSCPHMKRFNHFAGVALTPQLHVAETRGDQYVHRSSVYEASFGFAFEDMLRYRVSRHLDVHSLIACRANVNSTLLVHGFTMQLGAAYSF